MRVKGTAYLARLQLLEAKLGSRAHVEAFVARHRQTNPGLPASVLPTSLIPAAVFLTFIDAIVEEVYGGDTESLWDVGRASAEWSLQHGPYRGLLELGDVERFAAMAPAMWSNFFDEGQARSETHDGRVELRIDGIAPELQHRYFEYSVIGYFQRGLELLGSTVTLERVRGFSSGDDDIHYSLGLAPRA